jgi:NAD(P)-dependent dehydrogenase (short-subunit alcohol dehydrogenase family)
MDISGASAIITGGASGLGEATARALAARGAKVVIADLNEEKGTALASELGGAFASTNVTDTDQVIAAITAAHDLDVFNKVLQVNLVGTFNCIRLAATAMSREEALNEDGEKGAIVNTASLAAFDGQIGQAAYSASKGGVVGMTLPIARDLGAVGVRCCTIAPGLIDTPIYGQGEASEQFKDRLKKDVVFPKRLGYADEFASLAAELITNSYMNGETIRLDGAARLAPK